MKINKQLIAYPLLAAGFLLAGPVSAQGMMGGYYNDQAGVVSSEKVQDTNITAALKTILVAQKISDQKQIDCSSVTDAQFEALGDAYMGLGISEAQHSYMENMMGGEGSATLTQAHINMGRSYLGCWANYKGVPAALGSMMDQYGFAADNTYSHFGMMGWGATGFGHYGVFCFVGLVTLALVWSVLILAIIALRKWLKKNK